MSDVVRILIAPLVWLAAFTAMYALQGLLCGHGIEGNGLAGVSLARLVLVGAYASAIAAQAALLAALHAPAFASRSGFVTFVSRAGGWVGLVAAIWSMLPVVATSYCI